MKLYIPVVGDTLVLAKDWQLNVQNEYRNVKFLEMATGKSNRELDAERWAKWPNTKAPVLYPITIPEGTKLRVERVYIRAGSSSEFNSLTFSTPFKVNKRVLRFWAKLDDVHQAEWKEKHES